MNTINFVKIGSLVKCEYVDSVDSTRSMDLMRPASDYGFNFNSDGSGAVEITIKSNRSETLNGLTVIPVMTLPAITSISVAGSAVTNQSDFETKIATVFPNANSGSGGSWNTLDDVPQGSSNKFLSASDYTLLQQILSTYK